MQDGLWGSEPRWTVEPDEAAIKQTVTSSLNPGQTAAPGDTIKFLAQGAFNKVYLVTLAEKQAEVIARVTLPVDPKWKTLSEVATLDWVCRNTTLPVPEVFAYQADRASAIGFEWIAMSKMPGASLGDRWRDVSFSAKQEIARRLAVFCSEAFRAQLRGIGSLFLDDAEASVPTVSSQGPQTTPGHASFRVLSSVAAEFTWDRRIFADVSRGPFASSQEWLLARLSVAETDCRERLRRFQSKNSPALGQVDGADKTKNKEEDKEEEEDEVDENDLADLQNTMDIIVRLKRHLGDFFPPPADVEPTMILHDDLGRQNTLVDDDGNLTAVIDWESISAVPLWMACQIPPLFQSKPSNEEPIKVNFRHDADGNVIDLFWEHLDNYELTQLRGVFLGEMEKLQPEWVAIFEASQRQRDFDLAVTCCNDPFMIQRIREWLDDVEKGVEGFEGLEERIDNASL